MCLRFSFVSFASFKTPTLCAHGGHFTYKHIVLATYHTPAFPLTYTNINFLGNCTFIICMGLNAVKSGHSNKTMFLFITCIIFIEFKPLMPTNSIEINQSIIQSINQLINQSNNHSIVQSINQPTNQSSTQTKDIVGQRHQHVD